MNRVPLITAALVIFCGSAGGQPATTSQTVITLAGAKQVIAAAVKEADRLKAPGGSIAVVDAGGHLIALERLDNTFVASADIAVGKARTAVLFKKPTRVFEDLVNGGRTTMVTLPDFTPLQGGVPVVVDGQVVGALGVSGAASAQQDEDIARVGAEALAAGAVASAVTYLDRDAVTAAFARGAPLLETPEYKVHASRRTGPGLIEVHAYETDIVYVLEGEATFVTGGRLLDGKVTAPGEIRGSQLEGGNVQQLAPGDVVVVPRGTPHWFREIGTAPFLYFVVKPIAAPGGAS
ncbi:MAG: heme-binding protein [Gammaproteobacteria bacterium]|nr:heme-binding protein [Gammaproteobacteria bacterium]